MRKTKRILLFHSEWMFAIILCTWTMKFLGQVGLPIESFYLLSKSHFTCIRNSIFSSRTSSARWFLILDAGSSSKCWGLNFSCSGRLNDFWSHSNASLNCCQTTFLPLIFRHRGFPLSLLFSILFLIFFMLCWMKIK